MFYCIITQPLSGQGSIEHPEVVISVDKVTELKTVRLDSEEVLIVGSAVTLTELETKLKETISTAPGKSIRCNFLIIFLSLFFFNVCFRRQK